MLMIKVFRLFIHAEKYLEAEVYELVNAWSLITSIAFWKTARMLTFK